MKRIMTAVAMYSTDDNDHLPHPTWGSDLTGPDGWAYATRNPSATGTTIPGGPAAPGSAAGQDINSAAFSNQVSFYKIGQLARYLESQRVLVCPTDWRESRSTKRFTYIQRAQKLTSYVMNGTVGGYIGPKSGRISVGATYQTTDFLPTDILFWEQNDSDPFYFNDAGANPEVTLEPASQRHAAANGEGVGVVGRVGGTADFMKWGSFTNLQVYRGQANDLLNGPSYQ